MRYFTKEWHHDTILAEMCFQLKKTSRAAKFSESFFQYLYKAQKKWFVNNQKHIAKFNRVPFDATAAEAAYEANYNENLEFVEANIPAEILEKVADVRVLAMGSATGDVVDDITRFCGKVDRKCKKISEDYDESLEKLAEKIGWYKINRLNMLTNAELIAAEATDDGKFVLRTSPDYTEVSCEVILTAPKIATYDKELLGAMILYLEILEADEDGRIELNLFAVTQNDKSVLFSATASDIICEEI